MTCELAGNTTKLVFQWRTNYRWYSLHKHSILSLQYYDFLTGSTEDFGNGTLLIRSVTSAHQGIYTCLAVNRVGQALATADLEVTRKYSYTIQYSGTASLFIMQYIIAITRSRFLHYSQKAHHSLATNSRYAWRFFTELFPRRRLQRKPLGSDHGMHHGTCRDAWRDR